MSLNTIHKMKHSLSFYLQNNSSHLRALHSALLHKKKNHSFLANEREERSNKRKGKHTQEDIEEQK